MKVYLKRVSIVMVITLCPFSCHDTIAQVKICDDLEFIRFTSQIGDTLKGYLGIRHDTLYLLNAVSMRYNNKKVPIAVFDMREGESFVYGDAIIENKIISYAEMSVELLKRENGEYTFRHTCGNLSSVDDFNTGNYENTHEYRYIKIKLSEQVEVLEYTDTDKDQSCKWLY